MLESGIPVQTAQGFGDLDANPRYPSPGAQAGRSARVCLDYRPVCRDHDSGTDETRSYSFQCRDQVPAAPTTSSEFIYEGGKMSTLWRRATSSSAIRCRGPYGTFTLREDSDSDMIFIGGGAGLGPLWLYPVHGRDGHRPQGHLLLRSPYGEADLSLDKMQEISGRLTNPVRAGPLRPTGGRIGETGLITDVVDRLEGDLTEWRLICGPRPWSTPPLSYFSAKALARPIPSTTSSLPACR